MLQARENLMKSIQTFLKKFNRISFRETPKVLSLAWEKFFEIQHALREKQHQLEDMPELLHKLLKDLQIISEVLAEYMNSPSWNCPSFYDEDDEEFSTPMSENYNSSLTAITPDFLITDSIIMEDKHLDTILETESNEENESSVEDLNLTSSESEDLSDIESECDVPVCDDFTTSSNPLFDSDDNFSSIDDESFSDKDVPKEIYSNPLFDEEIISTKIDLHHFNTESDLIESLRNQDTLIISSPKFDSLLEEFFGELAHIDLIPPGINEADFDPEEEIRLVEKLFYDNSSPRPPEEFNSENSDTVIESFSPSPIPVKGTDSLMKEIDIFLAPDDSMPPALAIKIRLASILGTGANDSLKSIPSSCQYPLVTNRALFLSTPPQSSFLTSKINFNMINITRSGPAGSENRPHMLNKENYVPWSFHLIRFAKSRPNGKLMHNAIINGPYVRRMIPELGDPNREVPVNETFHVQTDDEPTEKELKQIEADDQAI
uniref:Uncharacterized protein n=1 Tax=Tanacetum cinerariifolium TaxID=118510 RepID=A0A6L2L988_TANCI|nr:hypothetical protein [Tanacetum cinerariifolium]